MITLAESLAWLGTEDCPCLHRYGRGPILYGIPMMDGWIRTSTDPRCPHHGDDRPEPVAPR